MLIYYKMTFSDNENDDNNESDEEKRYAIIQSKNRKKITINTKDEILNLYILNDGRIFVITKKKYSNYKKYVYNISNDVIVCDIYEPDDERIEQMIQISNNIIVLLTSDKLKLIQIKKHSFDEIQSIDIPNLKTLGKNLLKISNEKICIRDDKYFKFYDFIDGKLQKSKLEFKLSIKSENIIRDYCIINKNEIAIHYEEEGKIWGSTDFLMFYDIKNNKEIKTLKLGDGCAAEDICLINDNYLASSCGTGFRIIDIKNRKLIKEINCNMGNCHLFQLNLNFLCLYDYCNLKIVKFENIDRIIRYSHTKNIDNYNNLDNIKICRLFSDKFIIIKGETKVKIYKKYNNYVKEKVYISTYDIYQ